MQKDLYSILGVSKTASLSEIKKAYRKLARTYHPDRNPNDAGAEAKFKEISMAFDVLGDEEKRKLYDEFGMDGLRPGFNPEHERMYRRYGGGRAAGGGGFNVDPSDFEDIFSMFTGGGFGGAAGYGSHGGFGGAKGRDIETTMSLDYETSLKGDERSITVEGVTHRIKIPSGAMDGDVLKIKGKGRASRSGGEPGDLRIKLSVAPPPNPNVTRDGVNLTEVVRISMRDAILGCEIKLDTPQGAVSMTVKPLTSSGTKMRLKGKGIKRGSKIGHYYVTIGIDAPSKLTDEVKEAAEKLSAV